MTLSRQRAIGLIVAVVVIAVVAYGASLALRNNDPYKGLVTERPVTMEDSTRVYFEDRLKTTQAAIAALEAAGETIDLNLYLSVASDAYSLGHLAIAREALELQLAGNSINYVAWNNYALVLEEMGDYVPAESAFQKTLEIESGIEKYYDDYANFLKVHFPERRDDLKALYETSIEVGGQGLWNMKGLGDWYAADGQCDKAVDHYKVAVTLDPENQALKDDMMSIKQTCVERE
ncbi:MAG: hypothetical protein QG626_431 [Patescibacteria group bacterium]|jgi:tetratricopeptide (TPR) repeat protein|nr:hypothetical protein [Patescibacteria group bacterium]